MVQADPVITEIYNPQNWNPYSYVLNNPLNLTDPSGYSFISKYWRTIAAIVVTVYTGGLAAGAATSWAAAGWSIGGGFVAGAIQTNSLRGGVYGAFSAGVFSGIGTAFGKMAQAGTYSANALRIGKVVAHGMAGGVMNSLQGGKFGHGFVSAGATQAFSPGIDRIDAGNMGFSAQRTLAAATLGGTVSAMTGGKFANGAVTAAFSRAFNDEKHRRQFVRHFNKPGTMERAHAEAAEANNTLPNGDIAYVGHGSSIALQNDQIVINGKPDQMYGEDVVADIRRFMREQGISYREGMTFMGVSDFLCVRRFSSWPSFSGPA